MATVNGGSVRPHVQAFADDVARATGVRSISTYVGHQPTIDRALDIFHAVGDHRTADAICAFAVGNLKRYGVDYIISRQRIYNPEVSPRWRDMEDRGGVTQNHLDHVHVSFELTGEVAPDAPEERKETVGENLTVVRSGLVLDAAGWGTANGTPVVQWWGSRGQKNQQAIFTPNPHHGGHWISFAHAPNLVLDQVPTEERKHELHLWGRSEAKWQAWAFEGVGDESDAWRIRNLWSDMVVDIADMSKEPGARVQMWDWHGKGNQRFVLSRFR